MPVFGTGPKRTDGQINSLINTTLTYLLPNQVPNLAVWFDASDTSTITTNISSLNQWYSKTPISYLMSNTSGLPGPVWVSTTQNGLGVMRFRNNSNSYMSTTQWYNTSNFVTNNETTMFLAYNPTNNGAPFGIQDSAYGTNLRIFPQCGQNWFCGVLYNSPNNGVLNYSYPVNTGFKVESYFGRQSTLGVRLNGSLFTQSTMATGLSFPAGVDKFVQMGAVSYGGRFFTQDIGEALIYNRGLSDFELRGVEAYLARKWGTQAALPYRHPGVRTGPPLMGYRLITYPRLVSNYGLWYDAMDTSTIRDVGGNFPPLLPPNALGVAQWNDKSGNNKNLVNNNTNIRFNLLGNNFYPEVSPNAHYAALILDTSTNPAYVGCNISAFFVLRVTNPNFNPLLAFTSSFNAMPNPVSGNPLIANSNSTFDFTLTYTGNRIGLNRFGIVTSNSVVQAPYFGSTALIHLQVNGTQNTIGNVLPSTNMISINSAFVSSSSFYAGNNFNFRYLGLFGGVNFRASEFAIRINEVAVFYRTLTTPERLLIENQLINKWKLPSNAPVSFINDLPVRNGLFGWYDAYDQTTVLRNSSNNVSMWLDKSGQSNHMSTVLCQFGSNTRSNIYYSSIGVSTNSLSALFFPSTFAIMTTSSLVVNQSFSTFSMISVGNFFKLPNGPTPRNVSLYSTLGGQDNATLGSVLNSAGGNIPVNNLNERFSTFHINTMLVNLGTTTDTGSGILTSNAITYFNGVSNRITTGLIYSGMIRPSYISLMGSGLTNTPGEGDLRNNSGSLAEVLLYNRILNNTEVSNVHSYLLNKWNISTIVSNVPVVRGLNLWLDAYDPATVIFSTNTNLVQQWRDKSISTLHFSNALTNGALRPPTYTTNPTNNLPGLLFSNSASIYATALYNCNFNYPLTKEATIFTVAQWSSGNASYYSPVFCMLSNNEVINNTSNNFIVVGPGNGNSVGLYRGSPGGFLGSIGNTLDRPTLVTGVFNSSFSTSLIVDIPQNHVALGRNGMIGSTNISSFISTLGDGLTITATDFNVNQAVLGLRAPAGGDQTWNHSGYIHEVLLYNRTLSFVERQQVESYLLSKWYI